ncbi:MAG: anion permease [Magnetococcales bacterium]|nr:anion permease [Magnetococcales bacterium]
MSATHAGSKIIERLLRDPIFTQCHYPALARLLPAIEERVCPVDTALFQANTPAEGLFLVTSGTIRLQKEDGSTVLVEHDRCGEESATDFAGYFVTCLAITPVEALFIPRTALRALVAEQPQVQISCVGALMSRMSGQHLPTLAPKASTRKPDDHTSSQSVGWLLATLLPIGVLVAGEHWNLDRNISSFLAISAATVMMWMFTLVDDYIPGLFAIVAILMAGLVPPAVVLSGFTSNGFLMAMSILGLSTVIVSSGLGYRTLLLLLYHLPGSRFWNNFGLAMTGFFLTPMIPSINARLAMVTPFFEDMVQNLRFTPQGGAATQLAVSAFNGVSLMSALFVTSKSVNFALFSLLSPQAQDQFQGMGWLTAASVFALIMLLAHGVCASVLLRNQESPRLDKTRLESQLALLGPLKHREWAALLGIGVFILGMASSSLHRIQPTLLGMAIFYGLLLFGSLRKKELTEKVDWPFLLYLCELTGLVSVFNHLGLDQHLASALPTLGVTMRDDFGLFVLLLFLLVSLVRLVIPISITIIVLITLFIPLAGVYGVNPWIVGFIILIFGEIWFMPYQCSYYQKFQEVNTLYRESTFLAFNAWMNLFRLLAIYASFPYWKMLGLL